MIFLCCRENVRVWLKRRGPSANFISLSRFTPQHPSIHTFSFPPTIARWELLPLRSNSCESEHVQGFSQEVKLVSVSTHSVTVRKARLTHSIYALRTQECLTCKREALSCVFVRWSVRPTPFNPADVRLIRWQTKVTRPHRVTTLNSV